MRQKADTVDWEGIMDSLPKRVHKIDDRIRNLTKKLAKLRKERTDLFRRINTVIRASAVMARNHG